MAYDQTIPKSGSSPSLDFNGMRNNFQQIQSSFSVNHEPLGSAPNGYHTQIQLAAPVVDPNIGGTVGSIYTKGSPTNLFFQDSSNAVFQLTGPFLAAGNGYVVLGGIYFQWGHRVVANTLPVPFNIPFPHACFNVQLTSDSTGTSYNVTGLAPNQFTWASANPSGSNAQFYWFAIGN